MPQDHSWKYSKVDGGHRYTSAFGSVTIFENPWRLEFRDAQGKLLTRTDHDSDNTSTFTPIMPFSFVRRAADYSRSMDAVFTLSPGEKIFGCGESFTSLDKRGQKIVLWTDDANGIQNQGMYKPIPFFMSNRGYGMFIHTSFAHHLRLRKFLWRRQFIDDRRRRAGLVRVFWFAQGNPR